MMRELHDRLAHIYNKGTVLPNKSGTHVGYYDWREFSRLIDSAVDNPELDHGEWSYTLSEAEVGMFAIMSFQMENTPHPHGGPRNVRFVGRIPRPLQKCLDDFFDWKGNRGQYKHQSARDYAHSRFANLVIFNDGYAGVSCSLENGAEIVRLARKYYS